MFAMKDTGAVLSRIFLGLVLLGGGALLVLNIARIPKSSNDPASRGTDSGPLTVAERPEGVGNARGEDFLLKVERPAVVPAEGVIRVTEESFSAAYDELYNHRDAYYGREIEIGGYVLSQDDLGPGAFLVGRDLIWCCEDDKYFIGFLAFTDDGAVPEPGTTILVRGVLEAREYRDTEKGKSFMVPAIRASRVDALPGIPRNVYQSGFM